MKYTKEVLEPAVARSISWAGVLRQLGIRQSGGSQSNIKRTIHKYGISTAHFRGQGSNFGSSRKGGTRKLTPEEVLILRPENSRRNAGCRLKRALLESGRPEQCSVCSLNEWNGKKLLLIPDHKNGKCWDDRSENLDLLCPNCHSQTKTFAGRNIKNLRPNGGMHTLLP